MNATKQSELLSLPQLSLRIGVPLDLIRKKFRRDPRLAALTQRVGGVRIVRAEDEGKLRSALGLSVAVA